ncbi:hypothetical protein Bbelb_035910 [Branchiostoma belcheri]|nr:hypothetical protein Bbelb_035910 [Branchiostoma belcheri]
MPDPSAAQGAIEITVDGVVIKGPLLDLRMRVVPEPDNPLDKDAMVVVMSPLDSIPTADHDVVTDISSSTECPSTTGNRKDRLEEVHNQWKQLDPETNLHYEKRTRQAKFVTIEDLTEEEKNPRPRYRTSPATMTTALAPESGLL